LGDQTSYRQENWRHKVRRTPIWKRAVYRPARPLLSWKAGQHLSDDYLQLRPRFVLPERGMPLEARRSWVNRAHRIRGSILLVQGTGTGWDVVSWAAFRPLRIYAIDLYPFNEWPEVAAYVKDRYDVEVVFFQSALEQLDLPDNSIDIIASDAVYEHCRSLGEVVVESRRVLRDDGVLYATYGPLWFTAGGDHFSGRGGLETVYNHLRLSPPAYREYFRSYREPVENFQSGGRYVELDLFSRLTTRQYFALYARNDFQLSEFILEVSGYALAYRREYPREFEEMVRSLSAGGVTVDDLTIKTNLTILRPTRSYD
jgi:SAM-dependent methyltransferase